MELGKLLLSTLIFIFAALLVPEMESEIATMSYSGSLLPIVQAFPKIFVVVCAIFPIYFLIKRGDD